MKVRGIKKSDYKLVLELDKRVYPTDKPVTGEILDKWYKKNPEFGMIFEENGKIIGVNLIIPLNKIGWEKLIMGELAESELDDKTIFDIKRDTEIGLHCYHIEKLSDIQNFSGICFKELGKIMEKNKKIKVIGFSALCATLAGIRTFEKFGFKERDYICQEYILKKNGKLVIATSQKEADKKMKEGHELVTRCKMVVLYPNEKSPAWDCLG